MNILALIVLVAYIVAVAEIVASPNRKTSTLTSLVIVFSVVTLVVAELVR